MKSIVSLDIETTGLDPKNDAIIEIGAVKFNDRRVEDEWNTFIHPGRRIPPFITRLTGITDQMVLQAPPINDVLAELNDFIQDAPIVGHNVRFDLAFLNRYKVGKQNDRIDTYELASVLLPNASRYNLSALAQALGVPFPATHRALDDARATRGIYQRLIEEAYLKRKQGEHISKRLIDEGYDMMADIVQPDNDSKPQSIPENEDESTGTGKIDIPGTKPPEDVEEEETKKPITLNYQTPAKKVKSPSKMKRPDKIKTPLTVQPAIK